jgi:DNA-binding NtrC family response regulator
MIRLLFIDDDPKAQQTLSLVLEEEYKVYSAYTGLSGIELVEEIHPDVVLLDINLPDIDGLEVLERINNSSHAPPVIMLTAYSDVHLIKGAIQRGAYDYIVKPFDLEKLKGTIRVAMQSAGTGMDFAAAGEDEALNLMVGRGKAIGFVKDILMRYAPADSTVLIQGESGTGKELAAQILHKLSPRRAAPFIAINCGAIPESILETELFGSERGAYTDAVSRPGYFERADGGVIFLDEIGEMSYSSQAKLLRVLEAKEVTRVGGSGTIPLNLRVISASNRDLKEEKKAGRFREDLFYRISVLPVKIPPLRERLEDIPLLAFSMVGLLSDDSRQISVESVDKLKAHAWPGNIRELRNVIERG